jgi:hypothetical protein
MESPTESGSVSATNSDLEERPANSQRRVNPWLVALIVLSLVAAISAISLAAYAGVKLDRMERATEALQAKVDFMMLMQTTLSVGGDDVQRWLDTGAIRVPGRAIQSVPAASIELPLLCGYRDYARWDFNGLGC